MKYSIALRLGMLISFLVASPSLSSVAQQTSVARAAVPLEPVTAILDAFRSHDVVALGEGPHNNEQGHAFRMSLIRDARFANVVNDIVVECGNARYQDVVDQFVRGDQVSDEVLWQAWENAAEGTTWDVPIYEEFFRGVRAVNASLPKERHLRILLGDPPINWDNIQTFEDYLKWVPARNTYPAEVIIREVLARHRRAMVIYGDGHLWRKGAGPNLVTRIESVAGAKVFTVATTSDDLSPLQPDAASWRAPRIAVLRGTVIGKKEVAFFYREDAEQAGEPVRSVPIGAIGQRNPCSRSDDLKR
jgi:hypothetical protein